MPVRNEAQYIRRSLEAVLRQDYPAGCMEVLIADGMSSDGTRQEIAAVLQAQASATGLQPSVSLIANPGRIVPTGLNAALRQARGEIIIRVDGHCEIAPDYVRRCVEHLQRDHVDGVGGPIRTVGETPLAETIALAMSSRFGVGGSPFRTETTRSLLADSVPFPAYTRAIIQKAGLYDEELVRNQDDEYSYRLRELGAKLLLAADVRSTYYSRGSLARLWKQYYQYGYWKVRVLQKHPRQMRLRQFVPPVFVASLLIALLLAPIGSPGRWLLAGIGLAYLAANLAASLLTAARAGWRHLPLLPLVFAILHVSYGLGFLVGLVRFARRWGDKQGQVPAFTFPEQA